MIRCTLFIIFLLACFQSSLSQTSWTDAQKTKQAEIEIHYLNIKPYIYIEEGQTKGLETDIFEKFAVFVKQKYGINLTLSFKAQSSFGNVYKQALQGQSGTFAASSFSVTEARKQVVQFSPVYMPDIEILVSSHNLPILKDTSELTTKFRNVTAVVVPKTATATNIKPIVPYLTGLQYKKVKHFDELHLNVAQNHNHIAYIQLDTYLLALQQHMKLKRQNLFQINKMGRAIVLPLNSDWKEPINAFFSAPTFKPWINQRIKKYFGNTVKDLIWQVSNTESDNNKNVLLLTKEKELKELEIAKQHVEIKRQTQMRNIYIAAILGVFLIGFVVYKLQQRNQRTLQLKNEEILQQKNELVSKNKELHQQHEEILSQRDCIEKKNEELARTNKEVASSIQAAQVIQQGMLPYQPRMEDALKNYFVLYKPKDVVSGDFYWLGQQNNQTFLAAVDCTGHGVPGALMSMISYMILDKLVMVECLTDPAEILERCHQELQTALRDNQQSHSYGMDVAFIMLESMPDQQTKVTFAGAKRPLFYTHHLSNEIKELSGTRRSIGAFHNNRVLFANEEIVLDKGSMLYLTSDGFIDQNNVYRKKYSKKSFKKLLHEIALMPSLDAQQKTLEQTLTNYMQGTTQRDDILIIGIKI